MELSGYSNRKVCIFFYISGNENPEKKLLIFQETEPKKTSHIL